jgi:hypothetical protein
MKSFSQFLLEMIRKQGNQFVVLDSAGKKVLGKHKTKEKAMKQIAAIEISKKSLSEQITIPNRNFSGFYHPATKKTIIMPSAGLQNQHGFYVYANPTQFGLTDADITKSAGKELFPEIVDEYADVLLHLAHQNGWVRVHANDSGRKNEEGGTLYNMYMSSSNKDSLRQAIVDQSNTFGDQIDNIDVDYHSTKQGPGNGSSLDWQNIKDATIENRVGISAAMRKLF